MMTRIHTSMVMDIEDEPVSGLDLLNKTIRAQAREIAREEQQERESRIRRGTWPGYCASVQDLERGGWIAIVMLNRGVHRYIRKESFARFATSNEAYDAAERWLRRETEKERP